MSIFGRLATMPLADLLQWLSLTRRTGILALDRGATHKELFFHEGALVSASSTDPREYLSQFLLMHGKVDEKEYSDAVLNCKKWTKGKKNDLQCKKMVLEVIEDNAFTTGLLVMFGIHGEVLLG